MAHDSYGAEEVEALLNELDGYIYVREQLKQTPEGSDGERFCIFNAAAQWNRVISARDALRATDDVAGGDRE